MHDQPSASQPPGRPVSAHARVNAGHTAWVPADGFRDPHKGTKALARLPAYTGLQSGAQASPTRGKTAHGGDSAWRYFGNKSHDPGSGAAGGSRGSSVQKVQKVLRIAGVPTTLDLDRFHGMLSLLEAQFSSS